VFGTRDYIQSLERYVEQSGARLLRTRLPDYVNGRMCRGVITLRSGLPPEQELAVLVHELAHWLAHSDMRCAPSPTLCEYEAEAVERLVLARLGLSPPEPFDAECPSPTDGLLSASVMRAVSAADRICGALGVRPTVSSEAQAAVQIDAATREEVVLEYK
jgi:hypothetical protein